MRWFLPSVWPVQPDPHDGDHQEPQPRARQEEQGQRGERCQRNDRVALGVQEPAGAAGGHGTGRLLRRTSLGQVGEEDAEVSPGRRRPGPGHPQLMFSRVEPPCAPVLAQQRDRFVTLSIADTCGVFPIPSSDPATSRFSLLAKSILPVNSLTRVLWRVSYAMASTAGLADLDTLAHQAVGDAVGQTDPAGLHDCLLYT